MGHTHSDNSTIQQLPNAVAQAYDHAIADGKIFLYDTDYSVVSEHDGVPYQIHVLPSLGDKPPPSKELPDLHTPRDRDPFVAPFPPEEYVAELEDYHVFLNKFCLLPQQFMLVTKRWATQMGPLDPSDLYTAWKIVHAAKKDGQEILGFANIGPRSGASQPHRHLQFLPVPPRKGPDGVEKHCIPVEELLDSVSTYSSLKPTLLPLPYQHQFLTLPSAPTSESLYELYVLHLSLLPPSIDSHNVLLTTSGLHVIPRSERDTPIPLPSALKASAGGENGEGRVEAGVWKLSTNALGFAGWFFVEPEKERVLQEFGVDGLLQIAGVRRS